MTTSSKLAWGLAAFCALLAAVSGVMAQHLLRRERAARLEARNARAEASSTHRQLVALAGAMRSAASRLVEEHAVELSAAQEDLLRGRRARVTAAATIRILRDSLVLARATPLEQDSVGTLTASDSVDASDSLGVHAAVDVALRPAAGQALWTWRLYRPAIDLELTLACEEQNAVAHLVGPPWLPAEFRRVQQEDTICVPPITGWRPFAIRLPSLPVGLALFVAGVVVESRLHLLSDP